ncbi:MAG: hypothetical protein CMN74_10345 [Sphingorhabdus sp.]|nr:hypothetical protein [Sphingorhabdus sp.]
MALAVLKNFFRGSDIGAPADLAITPRDRRFGRQSVDQLRWWNGGDPYGTAFYNALSATFPLGEAFFVESVKAFRDGVPDRLAREVRAFTQQEVMHSREHLAFNRRASQAGYDLSRLEKRVEDQLALTADRPKIASLMVTIALEHFTAIMAHEALKNPAHFADAEQETADLWRWHAIEEIEHKGVAFDVWRHAARDWSPFKRWRLRSISMLLTTFLFIRYRVSGMLDLLAQDGITGPRAWWGLARFALVRPGMVRNIALPWLAYFRPGFHPWQQDDRALIDLTESDYAAAVSARAEPATSI